MTAIVGVLNTRRVAFAADSAATHITKSGSKITNHANKIFTLSKYHPVGVAVYSYLDFQGVPWDTIIKMFRNSQKDKKYASLDDYIKAFWDYIKKNCLDSAVAGQLANLNLLVTKFFQEKNSQVELAVGTKTPANTVQFYQKFIEVLDASKTETDKNKADDFTSYTFQKYQKYAKACVDAILFSFLSDPDCPNNFRKKFEEASYSLLCCNSHTYFQGYTGLVFFGYGEKELYPSCREYLVYYAVDNHI